MSAFQHRTTADFWRAYDALPPEMQQRADKQFALLTANPQHPSLQLKKLRERHGIEVWSGRVSLRYRALAIREAEVFTWFWVGDHSTYDDLLA